MLKTLITLRNVIVSMALGMILAAGMQAAPALQAIVEIEETVTTCGSPDNGAGPFWCYGSPLVVRTGDTAYVSAMEVGIGVAPLCNTRWRLFRRDAGGWNLLLKPDAFREREPCPIVTTGDGQVLISINPSTQLPGTKYGPCNPHLLRIDSRRNSNRDSQRQIADAAQPVRPEFAEGAKFTDHSYRGIGADSGRGEILVLNIDSVSGDYFWAFGEASGAWSRNGRIAFPIRSCYPQVALRERAAHVMAIGDIVEPVKEWREFKRQRTGREWDYVFRRLFYTSTPDIARVDFAPPLEIDTVEATAGHITNLDLWVDSSGTAHVLYLKRAIASPLMRDRFFPGQPIATTLEYRALSKGRIVGSRTLMGRGDADDKAASRETPGYARFHSTDGRNLLAVIYCSGARSDGTSFSENRLLPVSPREDKPSPVRIDLEQPLRMFFTAPERGGSRPSPILDLFGTGSDGSSLRYARVRIR